MKALVDSFRFYFFYSSFLFPCSSFSLLLDFIPLICFLSLRSMVGVFQSVNLRLPLWCGFNGSPLRFSLSYIYPSRVSVKIFSFLFFSDSLLFVSSVLSFSPLCCLFISLFLFLFPSIWFIFLTVAIICLEPPRLLSFSCDSSSLCGRYDEWKSCKLQLRRVVKFIAVRRMEVRRKAQIFLHEHFAVAASLPHYRLLWAAADHRRQ